MQSIRCKLAATLGFTAATLSGGCAISHQADTEVTPIGSTLLKDNSKSIQLLRARTSSIDVVHTIRCLPVDQAAAETAALRKVIDDTSEQGDLRGEALRVVIHLTQDSELAKKYALDTSAPDLLRINAIHTYQPKNKSDHEELLASVFSSTVSLEVRAAAVGHLVPGRDTPILRSMLTEALQRVSDSPNEATFKCYLKVIGLGQLDSPDIVQEEVSRIIMLPDIPLELKVAVLEQTRFVPGSVSANKVLELVRDDSTPNKLRIIAVIQLAVSECVEAVDTIQALLDKQNLDADFRVNLLTSLGTLSPEKAQPFAVKILETKNAPRAEQEWAIDNLGSIRNERGIAALTNLVEALNPNDDLLVPAIRSLVYTDTEGFSHKALFKIASSEAYPIGARINASHTFESSPRYAPALNYLRTGISEQSFENKELHRTAVKSLAVHGDQQDLFTVEKQYFKEQDLNEHIKIITALSQREDTCGIELLKKLLPRTTGSEEFLIAQILAKRGDQLAAITLVGRVIGITTRNDNERINAAKSLLASDSGVASLLFSATLSIDERRILGLAVTTEEQHRELISSLRLASQDVNNSQAPGYARWANGIEAALARGIKFPLRFDIDTLEKLLSQPPPRHDQLTCHIIYPVKDWNGAFLQNSKHFAELLKQGYHLTYEEAEDERDLTLKLQRLKESGGADLLVLGAHGAQDAMSFGTEDPRLNRDFDRAGALDLGDYDRFVAADVNGALKPLGQILLVSCSVGQGGAEQLNMVNFLRRIFLNARSGGIFGATIPTNLMSIEFNEEGRIKAVHYYEGETYQAK